MSKLVKTRPNGHFFPILSWLIMIFQGMNPFRKDSFSHMAIFYTTPEGMEWVVDSTSKGVRLQSQEQFLKKNKLVGFKDLTKPTSNASFYNWYYLISGRSYDNLQLVGLALKILSFLSFNSIGYNYRKMTCNEAALNYEEYFSDKKFGDPDNYDLNMTWAVL